MFTSSDISAVPALRPQCRFFAAGFSFDRSWDIENFQEVASCLLDLGARSFGFWGINAAAAEEIVDHLRRDIEEAEDISIPTISFSDDEDESISAAAADIVAGILLACQRDIPTKSAFLMFHVGDESAHHVIVSEMRLSFPDLSAR